MTSMLDYVKEYIAYHLDERIEETQMFSDPGEAAAALCSYDVMNGTILMDEKASLDTIVEWKEEAGALIEKEDGNCPNPFWRPGLFMVHLVQFGVENVFRQLPCLEGKNTFRMDADLKRDILQQLEDVTRFTFCN